MYESQHHINASKNMARYKQFVRPHRRLQLATVQYKKVYFGVKTSIAPPPLQSQPSSFNWMKLTTKLHCSMYFNLWNISKGERFSSCTRHEETGDISLRLCMPQIKSCHVVKHGCRVLDKSFNFQWFVLPPKFFANLAVTFFGIATVLSICCCSRHVKEDDRVFQLFVLQHDKW